MAPEPAQEQIVLWCGMEGHPQFIPGTEPADDRCPVCNMVLKEHALRIRPEGKTVSELRFKGRRVLAVPKSAVIDTGERTVVYVDRGKAGYVVRKVVLGPEGYIDDADGRRERYVAILDGLTEGDHVVTEGNFLIDSQSQITGSAAQAYGGAIGGSENGGGHQD